MTRKQDLWALRDKVADGEWDTLTAIKVLPFPSITPDSNWLDCITLGYKAHNGSLDAAKALHDAMLPGWGWETSHLLKAQVYHMECYSPIFGAQSTNPARAWLLAILNALIGMEKTQ